MGIGPDLLLEVYKLRKQHFSDTDIDEKLNTTEEKIEECESSVFDSIDDVVQEGIVNIGEVANETDLPLYLVFQIAAKKDLQIKIDPFNRSLIIQEWNEEREWQTPQYKKKRGRPKKVIKKRGKPITRHSNIDEMIKQGCTLQEMADVKGCSHQNIKQYINKTNQYNLWKAACEKSKLEEKQRKKCIDSILNSVILYLYNKANRTEQKAFEYLSKHRPKKITYDILVTVYTRYFEALDMGKKLSLFELGEGSELSLPEIGRILSDVGLEPLYGKRDRVVTPKNKKEAIKRAFSLDINCYDIAYFLDLPQYVVVQNMGGIGTRPRTQKWIIPKLSYRLASQIYQAKYLGFKNDEIKELLDTTVDIVEYAFKHESTIAPKIINALRILYPNKNITTPYK